MIRFGLTQNTSLPRLPIIPDYYLHMPSSYSSFEYCHNRKLVSVFFIVIQNSCIAQTYHLHQTTFLAYVGPIMIQQSRISVHQDYVLLLLGLSKQAIGMGMGVIAVAFDECLISSDLAISCDFQRLALSLTLPCALVTFTEILDHL